MKIQDFIASPHANRPHYLLVGDPVGHSLSPLIQGMALEHHGIDAAYHAVRVTEEDVPVLASWMDRPSLLGFNVTLPLKRWAYAKADARDPVAEAAGAANVMARTEAGWTAFNTDVAGVVRSLQPHLGPGRPDASMLVFGTGGASAAAIAACESLGINQVRLVTRSPRADSQPAERRDSPSGPRLGMSSGPAIGFVDYETWPEVVNDAAVIVNATPLGMHPNVTESPVRDDHIDLLRGKCVFDMVYNPHWTRFLTQAQSAEAVVVHGIEMLLHQAEEAFRIWTGRSMPAGRIRAAVMERLGASSSSYDQAKGGSEHR